MRPNRMRNRISRATQEELKKDLAAREFIQRQLAAMPIGTPGRAALWFKQRDFSIQTLAKRYNIGRDTVRRYIFIQQYGGKWPCTQEDIDEARRDRVLAKQARRRMK